jgi:branched-chain amino acid transport system substrate-binding protein
MSRARRPLWRIVALLAVLILVLAACGDDDDSTESSTGTTAASGGQSSGTCPDGAEIGFFGALTGPNAQLGINIKNGAQLAVDQFNAANSDCQVKLTPFDSQGDQAQAPALAQKAIQNKKILGIVGPAFSGESKTADPIFDEAGVPIVTPSATGTALGENGWKTFHRVVGNDNSQGPAAAKYIAGELKAKKAAVIDDASEYGKGIADIVRKDLKDAGVDVAASESIDPKGQDYSSTVTKVKGADVDVIFYGGYYAEAARLITQLRNGGVDATFVSDDGVNDQKFIDGAGKATEGSIVTCPCAPVESIKNGAKFKADYNAAFKTDPGTYSAEGFDAANVLLEAIKNGADTPKAVNDYLSTIDYDGITKPIKFTDKGEISEITVYAYKVEGGKIVPIGPIKG